jgi:cytochrome c oxidase subunit 1
MTPPPTIAEPRPEVVTRGARTRRAAGIELATSADHKAIAKLYLGTSLTFLAVALTLFALTRIHLIVPDSTIFSGEIFYRILSAAQVNFVVMFAIPFVIGLIGYIVPLQIGARSMALPRLNQLSYWLYATGAIALYVSFLYSVPETALSPVPPLSNDSFSPSGGIDAWTAGVGLASLGFVCFAINMVATLNNMRAPGMAWRRAPIFAWAARAISYVLLVAGPAMLAALTMLTIDRHFGGVFFDAVEGGEPLVFVHLSWIFFTGAHTIVLLAAFGAISEIVPSLSRKPIFSHRGAITSLVAVAVLGVLAWMQNMYAAPIPEGFLYFAMLAAVGLLVPIGALYFNWSATMWEGAVSGRAPLVLALAGASLIAIGLAGQLATSVVPVGLLLENTVAAQQDTIMVMAGFVLTAFAALHYWLPKITGRAVAEGPAKLATGLIVVSAAVYGLMMFFAGLAGQPVDIVRYFEGQGVSTLNLVASIASFFLLIGILVELANLAGSYGSGRPVGPDPWRGSTLEWFTTSPPPVHNFDVVPDVRSAEPMRDIREAIREREAAYVPPAPLSASAPPEVGQPDPGGEGGLSEDAVEMEPPTADPDDIVAGERDEDSSSEAAEEPANADANTPAEDPTPAPGEESEPAEAESSDEPRDDSSLS